MSGEVGEAGRFGNIVLMLPDGGTRRVPWTKPEFRIGSDASCDLVYTEDSVAPFHALLRWDGHQALLSRQGNAELLLNFVPIQDAPLAEGDVITVHTHRAVYHEPAAPPLESQPSGVTPQPPPQPSQQTAQSPQLTVQTPSGPSTYLLKVGEAVGIGSDSTNQIQLDFASGVAPMHARIDWAATDPVLTGVEGQVTVNGETFSRRMLLHGDYVRLGTARLTYFDPRSLGTSSARHLQTLTGLATRTQLGTRIRIGRATDNQVQLVHVQVSAHHAEVHKRKDKYYLVDLDSANGTYLNGALVTLPTLLERGDHIRISDFTLYFDGQSLEQYSEEGNARIDAIGLTRTAARKQVILNNVSFTLYPREFVALVGVSGAGKSTLMNALCGFRPADQGVVLVNGQNFYTNYDSFRSAVGYVPQDDIIHRELTVYRALYYAARLRMPADTSRLEIEQRIDEVLADLHLTSRRDTPVSRLSGGQRKRVSIGVELLTSPRLFFLDEPTSGLDPALEREMMRIFRNLADKGHTLVVITHATKSISLCDKVLFLAAGGNLAFFGSPEQALTYFQTDDFTDIYVKLEEEKSPAQWSEDFKASPFYQRHVVARAREVKELVAKASTEARVKNIKTAKPATDETVDVRQCGVLTRRYLEILGRDPGNLAFLMGSAVLIAALISAVFALDLLTPFDPDNFDIPGFTTGSRSLNSLEEYFQQAQCFIFFLIVAPIFFGLNNAIREIARESAIYRRERRVGLQILPYVTSKVLVLGLFCALQVGLVQAVVVWRFHLPADNGTYMLTLFGALFLSAMAAVGMGLAASALVGNENKAAIMLPALIIPQLLLTGKVPKLMGDAVRLTYLGLTRWSFGILDHLFKTAHILPTEDSVSDPTLRAHPQIDLLISRSKELDQSAHVHVLGHLGMLALWFALFIALTCGILRLRDKVKE